MLLFLLSLLFFEFVFCNASQFDCPESTCGNGVVEELDEECDGVEHCTNCRCDDGYEAIINSNECKPICEINGCIGECIAPNVCNLCNTTEGYASDCHACNMDTHYAEGYLNCVPNPETYMSCNDYLESNHKQLSLNSPTVTITPNELGLSKVFKSRYVYGPNPLANGTWVEIVIEESGYYSIETIQQNTYISLFYAETQETRSKEDTVLFLTDTCPSNSDDAFDCIEENNDVSPYVTSSRILRNFDVGTYYSFVFSPYNKPITYDISLYISSVVHPCSTTCTVLSWPIIVNGYKETISSGFNTYSTSACILTEEKGVWYYVGGNQNTLLFDTCDTDSSFSTSLHVLQVPKDSNAIFTNLDCTNYAECLYSSYSGCSSNDNQAAILIDMDSEHDYFIHVVQLSPMGAKINISAQVVCPLGCGDHGSCNRTGNCVCEDGYIEVNGRCTTCGNGVFDDWEECDPSVNNDELCEEQSCYCLYGYSSFIDGNNVECRPPTCGNGEIDSMEECDGGIGCLSNCMCADGYVAYSTPRKNCLANTCGNGVLDKNEECDGGSGCFECECEEGWYEGNGINCQTLSGLLQGLLVILILVVTYVVYWFIVFTFSYLIHHKLSNIIKADLEELDILEGRFRVFETQAIPFEPKNSKEINIEIKNPLFEFDDTYIKFTDCNNTPDVDIPTSTTIFLTNKRQENLHYIFHGVNSPKYDLIFKPPTGILKMGKTVEINVYLLMKCTCVVDTKIPVTLRYGQAKDVLRDLKEIQPELLHPPTKTNQSENSNHESTKTHSSAAHSSPSNSLHSSSHGLKKKQQKTTKFHTFLNLQVSSGLSTKLDYDEIHVSMPCIGKGTFGVVYKGVWRSVDVAVKQLKTEAASDINVLCANFRQEAELMEKIRCPYIIGFIGCVMEPEHLCLLTEFCPLGSLRKYFNTNPNPNVLLKHRFCQDIASGMEYLHINDILHSDLKTDNILVVSSNPQDSATCKVTDFGTSRCFIDSSQHNKFKDIGTPMYMAPEVHQNESTSLKSDVYSFAICVLEIWKQEAVYDSNDFPDSESILKFVCSGKRPEIPPNCPYTKLITNCWSQTPSDRPSFNEISILISAIARTENDRGTIVKDSRIEFTKHQPSTRVVNRSSLAVNPSGVLLPQPRKAFNKTQSPVPASNKIQSPIPVYLTPSPSFLFPSTSSPHKNSTVSLRNSISSSPSRSRSQSDKRSRSGSSSHGYSQL
ncbi:Protein kinase domain containing protein [Entamoeba marina]